MVEGMGASQGKPGVRTTSFIKRSRDGILASIKKKRTFEEVHEKILITQFQKVYVPGTGKQQGQKCHSLPKVLVCCMGFCRRGNIPYSELCLPSHNTSFTTGQYLKPPPGGGGNTQKLTTSATSFQACVLSSPWVSFVCTMARGHCTIRSCWAGFV